MTVIDYLKKEATVDEIAEMLVYSDRVVEQGDSYFLWNFNKLNGEEGMKYSVWTMKEAIEKAKEYLNSPFV